MYGLVNRGIEEMVCMQYGEETWEAIKAEAGVDIDVFISMEPYSDELTYQLVAAASTVLQMSPETILAAFGEYWTLYTAREGYGELLKMSGKSLPEFLHNLDTMHARVGLLYPELKPPSFRCTEVSDSGMQLHYHSTREGMAPLVLGLLRGLSKMFATELTIEHIQRRPEEGTHDIFALTYQSVSLR
ncbi:MAG: heme NO-binding domain-containing protein [Caldilineaceae bacterium]|nr:heme NO-binding domain-containing protein [Caldilineaceae bacterium]